MPLHVEITGDCSPREWEAIAALVRVMTGDKCAHAPTAPVTTLDPLMPELSPEARTMAEALSSGLLDPNAPAEATSAAAAAAVAAGAVLDSSGLPWDARIHASTKTKNKDETWKAARGVDPAMKAAVETELRAIMAVPAPPPELDPAAAFPAPTPDVPAPPVADVPAPPPPVTSNPFAEIMKKVVAKQAAGALNTEMTTALCVQLGLTGVKDLAARPDLIPAFEALLP